MPDVLIVESMTADDDRDEYLEGNRIADMLQMVGKKYQYFHPGSEGELRKIVEVFEASRYRCPVESVRSLRPPV